MNVIILTPNSILFDGHAERVTVPAYDGYVGILPKHISFVTLLKDGNIEVIVDYEKISQNFSITEGICNVNNDTVTISVKC